MTYSRRVTLAIIALSAVFGVGSMILFSFFLLAGGTQWVHIGLNSFGKHIFNAGLCLIFFFQHSIMIRSRFKTWLEKLIPSEYHGAIYSIVSGIVLTVLIVFWQPSDRYLLSLPGYAKVFLYTLFFSTSLLVLLSFKSVSQLDVLGIHSLRDKINGSTGIHAHKPKLVIKGPYRWVRHPLYLAAIIAIWASPHITQDRVMFNVLFTAWICAVVHLEEKDLIAFFGESYKDYQSKVPMLFPKSLFPRV